MGARRGDETQSPADAGGPGQVGRRILSNVGRPPAPAPGPRRRPGDVRGGRPRDLRGQGGTPRIRWRPVWRRAPRPPRVRGADLGAGDTHSHLAKNALQIVKGRAALKLSVQELVAVSPQAAITALPFTAAARTRDALSRCLQAETQQPPVLEARHQPSPTRHIVVKDQSRDARGTRCRDGGTQIPAGHIDHRRQALHESKGQRMGDRRRARLQDALSRKRQAELQFHRIRHQLVAQRYPRRRSSARAAEGSLVFPSRRLSRFEPGPAFGADAEPRAPLPFRQNDQLAR